MLISSLLSVSRRRGSGSHERHCLSLFGLLQQNTLDRVASEHQKSISHSLEAGSVRSGCQRGRAPVRTLSQVTDCRLLAVSSHGERGREFSGVSFRGTLISFMRAPPLLSNHFPKAPPPNTITLGIRFHHKNSEETQTFHQWQGSLEDPK